MSYKGSTGKHDGIPQQARDGGIDETYSDGTKRIQFTEDGLETGVQLLGDGLVDIQVNECQPSIAGLLNYTQQTPFSPDVEQNKSIHDIEAAREKAGQPFQIHLNIVIQVIGSRGDIQPFVALGQELTAHHHRVRIATHHIFRDIVLDAGLEFFSIGGDPEQLMAFMVQNPSLIPAFSTIRSGAIQRR